MQKISLFILLLWNMETHAQLPIEFSMLGLWNLEGYSFQGSFYPTNEWNKTQLEFQDNYRISRKVNSIHNGIKDSSYYINQWSYDAVSQKLRFYDDDERYYEQGKIKFYAYEFNVTYLSPNYFIYTDNQSGNLLAYLLKKSTCSITLEEDQLLQAKLKKGTDIQIDSTSTHYLLVNTLNPMKRKKLYFDNYNYEIYYREPLSDPLIESQSGYFEGGIKNFTDTSVQFIYSKLTQETEYKTGKHTSLIVDFYTTDTEHWDTPIQIESKTILLKDITRVEYSKFPSTSAIAPTLAIFSTLTTLLVAPLISLNFKTGHFNQSRYYTTAGIGLIGIGASIPVALICKKKSIHFYENDGKASSKTWRLEKVRK